MKILVISPTPSHPRDAGNRQRIYALLTALKDFGHSVHFAFIQRETVDAGQIAAMDAAWDGLTLIAHDRAAEIRPVDGVQGLDDWFLDQSAAAFEALARQDFDVVIVAYVFFSRALTFFGPETIRIIDTHDVFTDRHLRLARLGLPSGFFSTTAAEEGRGLDRADLVLAIQDEEAQALQGLTTSPVITLGHLPNLAASGPQTTAPGAPPAIGYLGSANPINVRALARFCDALAPATFAEGRARLVIGGGAAVALRTAPDGTERQGAVADLARFYAGLDLCVNPHEGGTGLKIKTVEGLSHGVPMIGTAEAFVGLDAQAAFHHAGSAAEVAGLVDRYIADPPFRRTVAAASAAVAAGYAVTVRRQQAVFRSAASLRRSLVRPRILVLTDIAFWQESLGNHARIVEQLRAASAVVDIDVLAFRSMTEADATAVRRILGARGRCFSFKDYPGAAAREPAWLEASARLAGYERNAFSRQYFAALEEHLATHHYQGFLVHYIRLSYLRHAKGLPALSMIDLHDVMALRMANFAHFGVDHFIRIEARAELDILDGFQLILAIQAREQAYLHRLFPGRVLYAPHVLPEPKPARPGPGPLRVVFVGGDSPMNRDGVTWFLNQVWPVVARHGAEFHLAGDICNTVEQPQPGVVLHGRLADLPGFLHSASVAVNPVFYGGGLKIKTVEYLCSGLPAVLTVEAAFGLPGGAGEAYLLATRREEFCAHLDRLLRDAALRQRVGEAAFAFGRRHFAPRALRPCLDTIATLAAAAV